MYTRFFGLKQEPFSLAPDPRYLYMSKRHREALAHLLYGVGGGGGFVLLSGEIGAGKTTVCRCFLEQIPKRCNVAYIFNPKLTVIELLKSVCEEFHIPYSLPVGEPATVKSYVDPLNDFLLKTHAVGQNNVLIIDEAQNLSADVLEQLRLLTNLETNERKLLQIVLIGQPELRTMLERPELEQLAQRVIARFHLKALSSKETEHYIRHRLSVAGMTRAIPFDHKALLRIHEIARGVPRRINLLCDRVMLGAYAHGRHAIDVPMIEKASREVFGRSEAAQPDRARVGRGAGSGLIVAAAVALSALVIIAGYGGWRRFTAPASPSTSALASASAPAATSVSASTLPLLPASASPSPSPSAPSPRSLSSLAGAPAAAPLSAAAPMSSATRTSAATMSAAAPTSSVPSVSAVSSAAPAPASLARSARAGLVAPATAIGARPAAGASAAPASATVSGAAPATPGAASHAVAASAARRVKRPAARPSSTKQAGTPAPTPASPAVAPSASAARPAGPAPTPAAGAAVP